MSPTTHDIHGSSGQRTTPCPLCGLEVDADALTCPRCKSRMDAAPARIGDLAGSFDESGTYAHDTLAATARLHLPSNTAPLPAVEPVEGDEAWGESYVAHTIDLSGFDIQVSDATPATDGEADCEQESDAAEPGAAAPANPESPAPPTAGEPTEQAVAQVDAPPTPPGATEPTATSSDPEPPAPAPKRNRIQIAAAVAAALFSIVLLGGGAFMAAQANTLNDITDERVEADIRADAQFAIGSASNAFVDEAPYEVSRVRLSTKELADTGVDAHATVSMGNEFFDESREVVVHYRKAQDGSQEGASEDGWVHECIVESHAIQPKRGISNDADYAIEGALAGLEGSNTCQVSIPFEGVATGSWFATSHGTRIIGYTFSNDAWERTSVDDSQVGLSYQNLVGSYASQSGRSGNFTSYSITSVDDATATFTGTFAYRSSGGLFSGSTTVQGTFSGSIAEDGTIRADGSEQAGSASFSGKATGNGMLKLEGTVYGKETGWLSGKPKGTSFSTTLEKKSDTPEALPEERESTSGGNGASATAPYTTDDDDDSDRDAPSYGGDAGGRDTQSDDSDSRERDTSSRDDWWRFWLD